MQNQNELFRSKKPLLIMLSILLVIGCIAGGTYAWLWSSTNTVVNTFTSGDVTITLAEETGATYKMVPGDRLAKDPAVTLEAGSEPAYVFLKVNETGNFDNYADYYIENGWQPYGGFVVDGVLDKHYKQLEGWYFTSWDPSFPGLEAYYSSSTYHDEGVEKAYYNGDPDYALTYKSLTQEQQSGSSNGDYCRQALELYIAYDHDYVYGYAKVYNNDYHDKGIGWHQDDLNHCDYFGIYWDPDPESRNWVDYTADKYSTIFRDANGNLVSSPTSLTYQKKVPDHGDVEIKFYPPQHGQSLDTSKVVPIPMGNKLGYGSSHVDGGQEIVDFYLKQNGSKDIEGNNVVFFEFYEGVDGKVAQENGVDLLAGYGFEFRIPRNDSYYAFTENGNPYFMMSIAAQKYHEEDFEKQYCLAFHKSYWLSYDNMMKFELNDAASPFAEANTQYYYKTVGDVADGTLTEDVTLPILRSGYVFGDAFADGYVQVHTDLTAADLENVTQSSNVTLSFDTIAIQQAHLTLDEAYELAYNKWSSGS